MKRVLTLLFACCFYSSVVFGQDPESDIKIDAGITGFKYAANFMGTKVFTKNGPADLETRNPTAFTFTIAKNRTPEDVKTQLDQFMSVSTRSGYEVTNLVKKDTILHGYKAFEISYTETLEEENYINYVFSAFIVKDDTILLFTSGDLDNGMYKAKFKETFYSLEPKKSIAIQNNTTNH